MDYKHTLNLPQTDFPMRGNLPTREPEILARWQAEGLYQRLLEANAGGERYLLHDGPPYANGNVHLGTALNKIIKDVIVKRQLMAGRTRPTCPAGTVTACRSSTRCCATSAARRAACRVSRSAAAAASSPRSTSPSSASSFSASACSAIGSIRI
jgi:hypothetical protein